MKTFEGKQIKWATQPNILKTNQKKHSTWKEEHKKDEKTKNKQDVLSVIANDTNTPIKEDVWISDCCKSNHELYAGDKSPQTKYHRQKKRKRVFEPMSGNCSKRKAEVQVLISDKVEWKAKSIKQKGKMRLLYCKGYSPQWCILNIFKSKHDNKTHRRKTTENESKTEKCNSNRELHF